MRRSSRRSADAHKAGLLSGLFLGVASTLFGMVAVGVMLFGGHSFNVVHYGLGIESRYVRVLMLPFIIFAGGYLFGYTGTKVLNAVSSGCPNKH